MRFGIDRDRDRDDRDDGRREFMSDDDYRRRYERDRHEMQQFFRDRDDDDMRYGHPSMRQDYDRDRDWVSRGGDDYQRNRYRDDYDRDYRMSRDDGYRSRDEERYQRSRGYGDADRDRPRYSPSRDDRGYGGGRYEQRDYGGYGEYGNRGMQNRGYEGSRGYYEGRGDDRRWASDRDEYREIERERGAREWLRGGRGRDEDRRY